MREALPAARDLPFERGSELFRIDCDEHEIALPREMLRRRLLGLRRGREMDEAVADIDTGALEDAFALGRLPIGSGEDFVDELSHKLVLSPKRRPGQAA